MYIVNIVHVHARMTSGLMKKAEEADTVLKQLVAVSAMCAAHSLHASALLPSVGHMSMLAQSLKNVRLDMVLHAPATQGATGRG